MWAGRTLASVLTVVAVVAIGTAAAAPDRKAPRIVAGVMLDRDRDQRGDGLRLTYSERLRRSSDRDGRYPFVVGGYRIRSVTASGGRMVVLRLVERPVVDVGRPPVVSYRRTGSKPVLDLAGNQAVAQAFRAVRPLVRAPVVVPPPAPSPPQPNPTAPPDLDPDRDGYVEPVDCRPNDPSVHPGATDRPDLGFADTNCDGVDGDASMAVFVSPQGNDGNPGTKDRPKRQVQAAVTAAALVGRYVLAAAGQYAGVAASSGVGIYGGYDPSTWERRNELVTRLTGAPEGLLANGAKDVTLQLLRIDGVNDGASAYGIRAINGASLVLQRVAVTAGDGAPGAAGATGAAGRPGGDGQPGARGACDSNVKAPGGAGGSSPVGRDGGRGGDGKYESRGAPGAAGLVGTPGGKGGAASSGHTVVTVEGDQTGQPGQNGSSGAPGTGGAGGSATTALAAALWQGRGGIDGIYGAPGDGGGGGGAGGGQVGAFVINGTGNGGAGGGGGGEGGRGGGGGLPGGGSFGLYLHGSTVRAEGSSIASGRGGAGGRGGNGGPGGVGGKGGPGLDYCFKEIGEGGAGGRGGSGGPGGGGGGGAGGPSIGVFKLGGGSVGLVATSVRSGSAGSAGAGGVGGAPGSPGQAGAAQAVYPS